MTRTLISTDKNGTKLFHCTDRCFKCGGTGIISCYIPINGGECFDCHGSGITEWMDKEYTPEYEAKLEARRIRREERKIAKLREQATEINQEFFTNQGFNSDGKTYFVLGNTFEIKEQLKSEGAKWDNTSRHWHMDHIPEGRQCIEISVEDMYYQSKAGTYDWRNWKTDYTTLIEEAEAKAKVPSTSEYIGEEGQRITLTVTYTHTSSFENEYGGWLNHTSVTNIHSFKDESGNIIIWKTSNYIEANYGTKLVITGTIKGYKEYKGTKQTVLTRCKLEESLI